MDRVEVKVPATTANLGPGFDCLGMALNIYNTVSVEKSERFGIVIVGEGEQVLPRGEDNLIYRAMAKVYAETGQPMPKVSVSCHNEIPLRRGLGSSAAAVVGGLVAANSLCARPLPEGVLLRLGWQLEGHPDNVAAALLGGCQVVISDEDGNLLTSSVPLRDSLTLMLFIPDFEMSTAKARSILPQQVSRDDAVYNLGRVALLVLSLITGKEDNLRVATRDRLHQPQRQQHLFPAMGAIFEAALEAGALGVFLSGGGSTIVALTRSSGRAIQEAMMAAAKREGVGGRTRVAQPSSMGAHIVG